MDNDAHNKAVENEGEVSSTRVRKPYAPPQLSELGPMSKLTQPGGGDGPNDGDLYVGRPAS